MLGCKCDDSSFGAAVIKGAGIRLPANSANTHLDVPTLTPDRDRSTSPLFLSSIDFTLPHLRPGVPPTTMNPTPSYGHSPPLHHPVPQHVSTVPQLRSPPPPVPNQPQQTSYGNAYPQQQQHPQQQQQGAGASGNFFGQYGQFINDPTAQVAAQFGQTAIKHGQEYLEQNVSFEYLDRSPGRSSSPRGWRGLGDMELTGDR